MVFFGYLSMLAAMTWLVLRGGARPWESHTVDLLARFVASVVVGCLAAGGTALVAGVEGNVVALVAGASLILGGLLFIAGLWLPRAGIAHDLRVGGWLLLCAPLLIPSTLTLALPMAALLVLVVAEGEPASGGEGSRVTAGSR